jgi:hypothetical protein
MKPRSTHSIVQNPAANNQKKPHKNGHDGGLTHISVYLRAMGLVKEQEPVAPTREG